MPSSPSSVCPGHRPALGTFSTISGGRERYLAISRTCVLYRSPIGRKSAAPSPNLVMYPQRSSLLFPVPMTMRPSVFAMKYRTIIRARARRFPRATWSAWNPRSRFSREFTIGAIPVIRRSMPSAFANFFASFSAFPPALTERVDEERLDDEDLFLLEPRDQLSHGNATFASVIKPCGAARSLYRARSLGAASLNANEATLVWVDEYSRMAEAYDKNVTGRFEPIAQEVARLADPKPGELFLDVGTGTGLLACLVAPRVLPQGVVAIDLADGAISVASYRAGNAGIRNIRFEMLDARNIVYHGKLFDGVASNLGVPALGYDRVFQEVHRVVKPTGRFVFSEWPKEPSASFAALRQLIEVHGTPTPSKELGP